MNTRYAQGKYLHTLVRVRGLKEPWQESLCFVFGLSLNVRGLGMTLEWLNMSWLVMRLRSLSIGLMDFG